MTAHILNNNIFSLQQNREKVVNNEFFGDLWPTYEVNINALKFSHIYRDDRYVPRHEFIQVTGIPLSNNKLTSLRSLADIAIRRLKTNTGVAAVSILEHVNSIKKGSKKFRRYLSSPAPAVIPRNITTFSNNVEIVLNYGASGTLNALWNVSYFSNIFRVFLFKFYNNSLGYNHVVAKFVANVDEHCTFCVLSRQRELERETALHVFYTCPIIEPLLNDFFAEYTPGRNMIRRSDFFGLLEGEELTSTTKFSFMILTNIVRFYIWETKLRRAMPTLNELRAFVTNETEIMENCNRTFRNFFWQSLHQIRDRV